MTLSFIRLLPGIIGAVTLLGAQSGLASSHREAPFITEKPKVDATDFYMFRSYESGQEGTVTLIANYQPLQDAYGGPNYFQLDEDAIYEIHVDNTGDAVEDITFRFDFQTILNDLQLSVDGTMVSVPLKNIGAIGPNAGDTANVQSRQTFTLDVVRGDRRTGMVEPVTAVSSGSDTFVKPVDNIGDKSFDDYAAYAQDHIYDIDIPQCGNGRVFVGQREESFAVNLGEVFDLVNTNPLGPEDGETNDLADKNVTSLALEIPTSCLTANSDPVIGGWTTASVRQARVLNPAPQAQGKGATVEGGAYTQVSRLGMPLVNEVVIGLKDKDRFNASEPKDDAQFATYVTNPTLPELLEVLFGDQAAKAPDQFPRNDLVSVFLTGVSGLNQPGSVTPAEMLRLNTSINVTAAGNQDNLGVLAGDTAGFPNGRRPGDDVVDAALRVAMGALLENDPNNGAAYTDGVTVSDADFDNTFPYLTTPIPGSVINN
jgi:hypothetical protein